MIRMERLADGASLTASARESVALPLDAPCEVLPPWVAPVEVPLEPPVEVLPWVEPCDVPLLDPCCSWRAAAWDGKVWTQAAGVCARERAHAAHDQRHLALGERTRRPRGACGRAHARD